MMVTLLTTHWQFGKSRVAVLFTKSLFLEVKQLNGEVSQTLVCWRIRLGELQIVVTIVKYKITKILVTGCN